MLSKKLNNISQIISLPRGNFLFLLIDSCHPPRHREEGEARRGDPVLHYLGNFTTETEYCYKDKLNMYDALRAFVNNTLKVNCIEV